MSWDVHHLLFQYITLTLNIFMSIQIHIHAVSNGFFLLFLEGHCSNQWPFCSRWYNSQCQLRSRYDVQLAPPSGGQSHLQLMTSYCTKCNIYPICMTVVDIYLILAVSDPFATVFGNESFGGGFADFSALAKVRKCCISCPQTLNRMTEKPY